MTGLKRKIVSAFLCFVLIFSVLPVYAAESVQYVTREQAVARLLETIGTGALSKTEGDISVFSDADRVSPEFADELGIAVANGIIDGIPGSELNPSENITRLEFAVIISRSIRELPIVKPKLAFSDVPAENAGDVSRLVQAGIINGYGNGNFGAEDFLTQNQLNIILDRIEKLSETRPQDDFYYAVNKDWLKTAKLPAGYPTYSSFSEVDINNSNKLKAIVKDLIDNADTWQEGTIEQKMADFYSTIVDVENRNKEGIEPIKPYLDRISEAKTVQELIGISAQFENEIGLSLLFGFGPSIDFVDSSRYVLYGSGLSTALPSVYMLNENPQIKALYENFIAQMFILTGSTEESALKSAQDIYAFEKIVAASTLSNEEASRVENIYNPMTVDEVADMFKGVDIKKYLKDLGYENVENVIITDVGLMRKTGELMTDENLEVLKDYARYYLVINTASFLSEDLENAINAFNSAFMGIDSTLSQEDKAFNMLNSVMSSYLGRIYVERYFSEEAKKDVEDIVSEIIAAFEKRIQALDWMTDETKAAAISKLKAIKLKIGYPDTWEDPLSNIEIKSYDEGGSLLGNILAITAAQARYSKSLLSKPVDKSKWSIPPHMVNAFYNATSNEIIFPAGILQAPFYDVNASREQNLGGIGTVIAHEITHAFDNNGAQFDKDGNMKNWWKDEDYITFQQKCQQVIDLYEGLEIAPGAVVSGALTLSENVADIGAMACILDIAANMEDVNYKELFESNARIWRMTATNQIYQLLATQDVHAPNKFRVNQVLRNFQEFYDTYGIEEGDMLYLAPEDRVTVW
ncbi:M13-type metalloendopeptidase [Pseudoclostridium thermosuccinogenes]|uniref:M13-type metalloendopeptidase n=1 Tax=Clostridium thermosuccinogenes TaxID=84032 RepID=UPI002FDB09E9